MQRPTQDEGHRDDAGSRVFTASAPYFSFLRRRLEALVQGHGTRRLVAIAHEDCSWYRVHRVGPVKVDLRTRRLHDLRRAAARIHAMFPQIAVETYYARLAGGPPPRVVFEVV